VTAAYLGAEITTGGGPAERGEGPGDG